MKIKNNLIHATLLCAAMLPAIPGRAQPVTHLGAGQLYSLFRKGDGSLWAMGCNAYGALGDGTYNHTNRPERIASNGVVAIAAGASGHSLIVKSDGSLWAVGNNYDGELGDGTNHTTYPYGTNRLEQILASNVTAVAAGYGHSLLLMNDGSLWGMGYNSLGQLGDGTTNSTNRPERIVTNGVTAIAAGYYHSLFLKSDGSLWAMGADGSGQLGDGVFNSLSKWPEQIVASNVTAIAAGYWHSLFLKNDGSLWVMGQNTYGQLGDGTGNDTNRPEQVVTSGVMALAGGYGHSLFLKTNGSLWAMGYNTRGQLGDGSTNNASQPEQIVSAGVTAIAAGDYHSLFIKSDGSLWAMGYNYYGELGNGIFNTLAPYGTNSPQRIVAGVPPGYNLLAIQLLNNGNARLSYAGLAGTNYALERSFNLRLSNWVSLATNPAGAGGLLVMTNTPNKTTNNFYRIRFVP